jgi:hypothetical protein
MDVYPIFLEGQWIEVPGRGGTFILEHEVNPARIIEETDYMNNSAAICVNIPPRSGGPFTGDPSCVTPAQFEEARNQRALALICPQTSPLVPPTSRPRRAARRRYARHRSPREVVNTNRRAARPPAGARGRARGA